MKESQQIRSDKTTISPSSRDSTFQERGGVVALAPGCGGLVASFKAASLRASPPPTLYVPHSWLLVPPLYCVHGGGGAGATSEVCGELMVGKRVWAASKNDPTTSAIADTAVDAVKCLIFVLNVPAVVANVKA